MGIKSYFKNTKGEWEKYWSLKFSLFVATILADYYVNDLRKEHGKGFTKAIIINHKGYSSVFLKSSERKSLGLKLISKYFKGGSVIGISNIIKSKADLLSSFYNNQKNLGNINDFIKIFANYTSGYHIIPRHIIDYLESSEVKKINNQLKRIRLYTEQVPIIGHKYLLNSLKKNIKYPIRELEFITIEEFRKYLKSRKLPTHKELKARQEMVAVIYDRGSKTRLITNKEDIEFLEGLNIKNLISDVIKGVVVYKSNKVKGIVKVILDPQRSNNFKNKNILVTGMTRPDFVPLMKKAGAIITDGGGLLCHAAIVAREYKKPCIIGTKFASQILKDGDLVEVDTNLGIIKILKKH